MNPLGTFLRVLGPEPWNVVYLEPSVRQDDSRYGQNPNRLSCHHQMQVLPGWQHLTDHSSTCIGWEAGMQACVLPPHGAAQVSGNVSFWCCS